MRMEDCRDGWSRNTCTVGLVLPLPVYMYDEYMYLLAGRVSFVGDVVYRASSGRFGRFHLDSPVGRRLLVVLIHVSAAHQETVQMKYRSFKLLVARY